MSDIYVQKKPAGCLTTCLNLAWMLTGGIWTALAWALVGLVLMATVVLAPLGAQAMKMASLTLSPFGRDVYPGGGTGSLVLNVVWVCLAGAWFALFYAIAGVLNCLTVVGIPFGLQLFKMARLSLAPFGAQVV